MILSILVTPLVTPLVGLPGFTFARTSLAATMVSSFPQLQAKAVAVPRMLQVMRACLGQGKRLNDILDRHADEWVITAESPASQTRPIGRLLERLLSLDHMDEAWGVWRWMASSPEAERRPTHPELLLMLRGLNVKGKPRAAEQVLQLYDQAAQRWAAKPASELDLAWHEARREAVCALGTLGRFREAVNHLQVISEERACGQGQEEVRVPLSATARARMEWAAGPRGWPSIEDEIVYYRSMDALLEESAPTNADAAVSRGGLSWLRDQTDRAGRGEAAEAEAAQPRDADEERNLWH